MASRLPLINSSPQVSVLSRALPRLRLAGLETRAQRLPSQLQTVPRSQVLLQVKTRQFPQEVDLLHLEAIRVNQPSVEHLPLQLEDYLCLVDHWAAVLSQDLEDQSRAYRHLQLLDKQPSLG